MAKTRQKRRKRVIPATALTARGIRAMFGKGLRSARSPRVLRMILLVRLEPPPPVEFSIERLTSLPPERGAWLAVAVRCADALELDAALEWWAAFDLVRPPLLLVIPRCAELTRRVALEPVAPADVAFAEDLADGALPGAALETLLRAGVFGRVERRVLEGLGAEPEAEPRRLLGALVAAGAAGWRLKRTARSFGMSDSALRRTLRNARLPAPGVVLRDARQIMYEELVSMGVPTEEAARTVGYSRSRWAAAMNGSADGPVR